MPAPKPKRPKGEEIRLLLLLATAGGAEAPVARSSREVGRELGVSQQAADRYLIALDERGLVTRSLAQRRQRIGVTPAGVELLRGEYERYRQIFQGPAVVRFAGTVVSGLGEGRYYLSQPGYMVQFSERLGYSPYPGTLNIKLAPADLARLGTVRRGHGVRIDGFKSGDRTFGGATCFPARLSGRECHAIVPDRTHHQDVVEFIAKEYLRDALGVKDGASVDVEVREA